jgi:hypothetical protein
VRITLAPPVPHSNSIFWFHRSLDDRTQVQFEIPVDGYDKQPWNGVTDYCLYDYAGI